MTTPFEPIAEAALAGLREPAPARPRPLDARRGRPGRRLRRHGLADRAAPGRLERPRRVDGRGGRRTTRRSRPRFHARTGRVARRRDALPDGPGPDDRAPPRRRPPQPDRPRPARLDRVRAGGLDEGPRDPARRGPAVRLDRRRDRPAEGGPGGRDGARPQPGAADRALPPGRPERRDDRPVLAGRAAQQADDPRRGGRRPRRAGGAGAGGRSATSARTRRRSTACRPATTRGGSPSATWSTFPSARRCAPNGRLPALQGTAGRLAA